VTNVIAHRGASLIEPENTVPAFLAARRLGADWVELDVRRTADGALAVHHDAALRDGRLVQDVRAGDLPAHVPLLDVALDACGGIGVNVEIKDGAGAVAADVAAAVTAWGGPVLVSSFDLATVDAVHDLGVPSAWLVVGADESVVATARERGHQALHPWDGAVTGELVAAGRAAGLAINVWTVDDPERMRQLAAWGVDGIVTNDVEEAVRVLKGRPG
jgi:glycerophosphoryl diester phosphodiesterase